MLTIKKKQIQKVSFPIDLRRKPNVVVRKILEWDDVRNHPNLSHMETLERNYIRPVIKMMEKVGLPNDKFYTVKIRENRIAVTDYWRNTFKGGTPHMHVSHFLCLMSVFDDRFTTGDLNHFKKFQKEIRIVEGKPQANPSDRYLVPIPDWEETKEFLSTIKNGVNKPLAVLSTLYYHGYVLRHGIVLKTIIIDGDPDTDGTEPSLNLETGRYYIPKQKSDGADFIVFDDCLDDLRSLSIPTNPLSRSGADRLVSCSPTIVKRKFKGIYATSIMRKSFIRWYYKHSGRTIEDIDNLSKIVGNTVFTMYNEYLGEQEKMVM